MTGENRKTLVAELINTAEELKTHIAPKTPERTRLSRIIRIAKLLYVDAIKTETKEVSASA